MKKPTLSLGSTPEQSIHRPVIGMANGCFDLLHEGHLHFLRECHKYCDRLIVAVNDDASVAALKGAGRPVETEEMRAQHIYDTGMAMAVIGFDGSPEATSDVIEHFDVDILFKGAEYEGREIVGSELVDVQLIAMLPGFSTTTKIKGMMQ